MRTEALNHKYVYGTPMQVRLVLLSLLSLALSLQFFHADGYECLLAVVSLLTD